MNRFTVGMLAVAGMLSGSSQSGGAETGSIASLVNNARPGQAILLSPGTYVEDVVVPPGVSLVGTDARTTLIVGSVQLTATPEQPVRFSRISLVHTGGRQSAAVSCGGGAIRIQHSLLISKGGFATVSVSTGASVVLRNDIVWGPFGDYALFGRDNARVTVLNSTIISHGFGLGLMDQSYASIRNCLFECSSKPAVIRTASDYSISYSNISSGSGSFYFDHDLINGDVTLKDPWNYPGRATPPQLSNDDFAKYDSPGLTFIKHDAPEAHTIDEYRKQVPAFAVNAGSPDSADQNADGTRNTLGAFGGLYGNWR